MPRITLKDLETEKSVSCPYTDALIGRDPTSALAIEGLSAKVVSGHHARVFFQDGGWWIQDLSRNGTVVDNERLIKGERHSLRVGQVIGLGDSGPRLRVEMLESRLVPETLVELPDLDLPSDGSGKASPRRGTPSVSPREKISDAQAAALRKSDAARAGLRIEEPTEPMKPSADWVVHAVLRMTHSDQQYDVRGEVIKAGRSPECAVQIPPELGASVSRVHTEIAIHEGGVTIRDAGSRNGTFVNGNMITEPRPAKRGDMVMLGPGGPTFTIEELRIVRGEEMPSVKQPRLSDSKRVPSNAARLQEPDTEPPVGGSFVSKIIRKVGKIFE
jgi:pSer/pThr/pTyr-binding forkhead associated (FHA) protein